MNKLKAFYDFAQKKLNDLYDEITFSENEGIILLHGSVGDVDLVEIENENYYRLTHTSEFSDISLSELAACAKYMNSHHSEVFGTFENEQKTPFLYIIKIFACENSDDAQTMGKNIAIGYLETRRTINDLMREALQALKNFYK